jgi:hypothetical protein
MLDKIIGECHKGSQVAYASWYLEIRPKMVVSPNRMNCSCRDMKHIATNKNDFLVGRYGAWVIEWRHETRKRLAETTRHRPLAFFHRIGIGGNACRRSQSRKVSRRNDIKFASSLRSQSHITITVRCSVMNPKKQLGFSHALALGCTVSSFIYDCNSKALDHWMARPKC